MGKVVSPLSQVLWSGTLMATTHESCSQFTRLSEMDKKLIL